MYQHERPVPTPKSGQQHPLDDGLTPMIKQVIGWQDSPLSKLHHIKRRGGEAGPSPKDRNVEEAPIWNKENTEDEITVLVPKGVDWGSGVRACKKLLLVGNVHMKYLDNRGSEFVRLRSEWIKFLLGTRDGCSLMKEVISERIVDRTDCYIPGVQSFGYRLSKRYRHAPKMAVRIKYTPLARKCAELKAIFDEQWKNDELLFQSVGAMRAFRLAVEDAYSAVDELDESDIIKETAANWLRNWELGNLYAKWDSHGHREYTNICNCPTFLRKFLLHPDGTAAEIDVNNSQPLLLAHLYKDDGPMEEMKKYLDWCCSGEYYQRLAAAAGMELADRKEFKQMVFQYIFFGPVPRHYSPLWDAMQRNFPWLSRRITQVKATDYAKLAIELQGFEAKIMIRDVLGGLLRDGYKVLSIHDSFLCSKNDLPEVNRRMEDAIYRHLGVRASFSTKIYKEAA